MEACGDTRVVEGLIPLAESFGYFSVLQALTQGRGTFTLHFERYEAVPILLAEEIAQWCRDQQARRLRR